MSFLSDAIAVIIVMFVAVCALALYSASTTDRVACHLTTDNGFSQTACVIDKNLNDK